MPAFKVKFVVVAMLTAGRPLNVNVLLPKLIVLTLLLSEDKTPAVTLKFLVSNVPLMTLSVLEPRFSASASSTVPP